jgi:hypothetical protein
MIVTWSGKLFTLRVSRCDFGGDYAELDQLEAALVALVVIVAACNSVVDSPNPGTYPG